jgi:hypothetical protein
LSSAWKDVLLREHNTRYNFHGAIFISILLRRTSDGHLKSDLVRYANNKADCAVQASADLAHAVRRADVVSCATLATEPVIPGAWLGPRSHLDLIGGFTPQMREADDACFTGSSLYVDTVSQAAGRQADQARSLNRWVPPGRPGRRDPGVRERNAIGCWLGGAQIEPPARGFSSPAPRHIATPSIK